MVNTPLPLNLKSEAKKAAKILKEFTVPTAKAGPDKLIPAGILVRAKGLAILTVIKAGFLVTARGGSGIVIAKLDEGLDSGWSAPSAIGIAGLGGGFEVGAEVTDFVIILNKRSAVEAFSKGGNLTLGGNFTIAAGPLGRNIEADVAVRSTAAIYTYSKTRGIFAGISVEGSALIERKDANKKFYGREIRAVEILRGDVDPPEECACLYEVLENHRKQAEKQLIKIAKKQAQKAASGDFDFKHKFGSFKDAIQSKRKPSVKSPHKDWDSDSDAIQSKRKPSVKSPHKDWDSSSDEAEAPSPSKHVVTKRVKKTTRTVTKHTTSNLSAHLTGSSSSKPRSISGASNASVGSTDSWELKVTATHPFTAQLPCDLSFKAGDVIEVLTRTDTQEDWWEGRIGGHVGIFPANYVRLP